MTTSDSGAAAVDTAVEPPQGGNLTWLRGRWIGLAVLVGAGIVLFLVYLAQARSIPATSESGGQALQAWDILHGNPLLRGWTLSDVSFYTTELPEYMLVELLHGLNSDTVHVAAALSYTLIVLLAGLLAKGRATGREGLVRLLIAGGILLAPPHTDTALLLGNPDHTGTHVALLIIWLVIDRAPPRWWVPVTLAILLTWAQIGDPLVLYEGAVPLAIACAMRAYRRRGPLAGQWYDLSLVAAALVSAGAARLSLSLIRHAGGFIVGTPVARFTSATALSTEIWHDLVKLLVVFGANFFSMPIGPAAIGPLIHLVGLALVAWAVAAGVRRLYGDTELLVQVLTIAFVLILAAYVLGSKPDANEIIGLLPMGAVLAGRLLASRISGRGLVPLLAVVLICYAGLLVHNAARQAHIRTKDVRLAAWLKARHLDYGLGGFWNATGVTVASGDRVQIRPVRSFRNRIVTTLLESDASWYNPRLHDARFVISSQAWVCQGVCVSRGALARTFGPPAKVERFGHYYVLIWRKNLLRELRIVHWCGLGWAWNTHDSASPTPCK